MSDTVESLVLGLLEWIDVSVSPRGAEHLRKSRR